MCRSTQRADENYLLPPKFGSGLQWPYHPRVKYQVGSTGSGDIGQGLANRLSPGPSIEVEDPCPYYYDAKLELKMYRGPGYKTFHPVLDSSDAYKQICQEWDERQRQPRPCAMPFSNTIEEQHCLEQVLLVFPDAQHVFVRKLFREHYPGAANTVEELQAASAHISGFVIAQIAELESFPKEKILKRKRSQAPPEDDDKTVTWDRELVKNETYYKESLILLANEFPRVPTHFIHSTIHQKGALFEAFQFLAECERTHNNASRKLYNRHRIRRVMLEKKYKRRAFEGRVNHQYVSIVNEFQAARQSQCREETQGRRRKAEEEAEANNFAEHQLQGSILDCACCYNEVPINRVVNCENDETHFFCNKCINTRAKEQIGTLKYEMKCMDMSGCGAELSRDALERALPIKTLDKLAEIQQLAEIKAANLDGLEQCPFCDFQAICAAVAVDTTFQCLNPSCEKVSCRKCKQESHLPRTCEEERKVTKGLSARHAIEEARSKAMMRPCPKCKVKIVKSDGCNKMTCSNCGSVMCYVCKKDITGIYYQHFGHSATAGCPVSDRSGENRHQQEADRAEKAAIVIAKARDADLDEEDLRIEAHQKPEHPRPSEAAHRPQPF